MEYYPSGQPIEPKPPHAPAAPSDTAKTGEDEFPDDITIPELYKKINDLAVKHGFDVANATLTARYSYNEGGRFDISWTIPKDPAVYAQEVYKYNKDLAVYQAKMVLYRQEHAAFVKEFGEWFANVLQESKPDQFMTHLGNILKAK